MSASAGQTLGRQALEDLKARGVSNPDAHASLDDAVIAEVIGRWDADPAAGTGALVARLKAAERQGVTKRTTSTLDAQAKYAGEICSWLWQNFPEICDERFGPHPAAVAALIRLDFIHGKGSRGKSSYSREIRAAVKQFDARLKVSA